MSTDTAIVKPDIRSIPIKYGMASCVGVNTSNYPLGFGNYFDLIVDNPEGVSPIIALRNHSVRVLNMWYENLVEAQRRFLPDGQVRIRQYRTCCVIDDQRIPPEWLNSKLCYTGYGHPPVEVVRDIYDYLGDPENELEQVTDPRSYWEKRGWTYSENGGLSKKFSDESRPLKSFRTEDGGNA